MDSLDNAVWTTGSLTGRLMDSLDNWQFNKQTDRQFGQLVTISKRSLKLIIFKTEEKENLK